MDWQPLVPPGSAVVGGLVVAFAFWDAIEQTSARNKGSHISMKRLGFGTNHTDVVGLVDSGATDCLFDRDVADDLGIKLADSDITREYVGVGGQSIVGHIHSVRFQIQGFSEWIEIEAGFIEAKLPYQLLGQAGFFDNYEISFQRYRGRFEVKSRSFLHRN